MCFYQLCFSFIHVEMYPSLLFPAFSTVPKINTTHNYFDSQLRLDKIQNEDLLIIENPKLLDKKGKLTTKDLIKSTNLHMICRSVFCDSTVINKEIDHNSLFSTLTSGRGQFIEREKFTNYPVNQDNFFKNEVPYTENDLIEAKLYLVNRVSKFLNIENNQESICELYIEFRRVTKKSNTIVHKTIIRLK